MKPENRNKSADWNKTNNIGTGADKTAGANKTGGYNPSQKQGVTNPSAPKQSTPHQQGNKSNLGGGGFQNQNKDTFRKDKDK